MAVEYFTTIIRSEQTPEPLLPRSAIKSQSTILQIELRKQPREERQDALRPRVEDASSAPKCRGTRQRIPMHDH
ncbi:unnamed protein product, partial [Trichogramma brassicae]